MALEEYFKDRLNELEQDPTIHNFFRIADRRTCADGIDHRMIFLNENVQTYHNTIINILSSYEESGIFAHEDLQELSDLLYTYYYVLKYVANNLDNEDKQFQYDEESIDNLIAEFKTTAKRISDYNLRKMCQD